MGLSSTYSKVWLLRTLFGLIWVSLRTGEGDELRLFRLLAAEDDNKGWADGSSKLNDPDLMCRRSIFFEPLKAERLDVIVGIGGPNLIIFPLSGADVVGGGVGEGVGRPIYCFSSFPGFVEDGELS